MSAKPSIVLPDGYVPEPLKRVPGDVDVTGESRPLCKPSSHGDDGKHSIICLAGILGYRQLDDGTWERLPPHPLDIPGARFVYEGDLYIRPVQRGIVLDDDSYLDALPDGDYTARIELVRKAPEA